MENKIKIDGISYIREDSIKNIKRPKKLNGMEYSIIRTYSAGVFAGYIEKIEENKATIKHARRIWKWVGAFTLSELAMKGVEKPKECKFSCETDLIILFNVIEIIPVTLEAKKILDSVEDFDINKN